MRNYSNLKISLWKFSKRFYSISSNLNLWKKSKKHISKVNLSNSEIEFSSGQFAKMTSGSALVTHNENAILSTVVNKLQKFSSIDGLSLSVDFRQSAAAIGRIPTNFFRKEMQQNDQDILNSRIIDRSLRPAFYPKYSGQTHIVCKPLAVDDTGDSVILGLNAASAALAVSDVPLQCLVAASRVVILNDKVIINPSRELIKDASLNMILTGTGQKKVVMIEMDGKEISLETFLTATQQGFEDINKILKAIRKLAKSVKKPKIEYIEEEFDKDLLEQCDIHNDEIFAILNDFNLDKESRDRALNDVRLKWTSSRTENDKITNQIFTQKIKNQLKRQLLENRVRCDGRKLHEVRSIHIDVNTFSKLHGSASFQRGQSQVFSTVTFDSPQAAFHPDSVAQILGAQQKKSFMLHYEFPNFAVNEIGNDTSKRREIGHGLLAEKSLKHLIPAEFPFTIRLASQVLESNGSTSMAATCSGSLALFDAGVPMPRHVSGVAMGLFDVNTNNSKTSIILTDIMGMEDYYGDMDFKIAGTSKGLTAIQLDMKICGITLKQLKASLKKARKAHEHILAKMDKAIDVPRNEFKISVPIMETMELPAYYKRVILFKSGAYNAKLIEAETGVKITAEDEKNLSLLAPNREKLNKAREMISNLMLEENDDDYIFGQFYKAKITEILENGIMVSLKPGARPILMRNSTLSNVKVGHASALGLKIDQEITVKYFGRDSQGFHRISRKGMLLAELPEQNFHISA